MPFWVFVVVDAALAIVSVLVSLFTSSDVFCFAVFSLPFLLLAQQAFVSCTGVWDPVLPLSRQRRLGSMGVYALVVLIHLVGMVDSATQLLSALLGPSDLGSPTLWAVVIVVPWLVWISLVDGLAPSWSRVTFYAVTTLTLFGPAVLALVITMLVSVFGGPLPIFAVAANVLTMGFAVGIGVVWLNLRFSLTPREKVCLRRRANAGAPGPD
jgi:hypothetical protein